MKHYASTRFWTLYEALPTEIQSQADRNFQLLKSGPRHPSLHFKKLAAHWSVRVGLHFRAPAAEVDGGMLWVWIGTHAEYDRIVG